MRSCLNETLKFVPVNWFLLPYPEFDNMMIVQTWQCSSLANTIQAVQDTIVNKIRGYWEMLTYCHSQQTGHNIFLGQGNIFDINSHTDPKIAFCDHVEVEPPRASDEEKYPTLHGSEVAMDVKKFKDSRDVLEMSSGNQPHLAQVAKEEAKKILKHGILGCL